MRIRSGWKKIGYALGIPAWVILCVVVSELTIGYLLLFILGKETFNTTLVITIYSVLIYVGAIGLAILLPKFLRKKLRPKTKTPPQNETDATGFKGFLRDVGINRRLNWTDIGLSIVGIIATLILASILQNIFAAMFPWFDANEAQATGYSTKIMGWDRIVAFLSLVVLAPVAEEMIFRGWLYGKLREKLNNNTWGIIISILLTSLAFGIVHFQWNVGITVFAMSVVACLLREVTGSIHAGILVHMIKNGLAFYLIFVLGMMA